VWSKLIPKWKGYKLRQELVEFGGGAEAHHITKVPVDEIAVWDATHDATGKLRRSDIEQVGLGGDKKTGRTSSEADSKDISTAHTKNDLSV
jgi:hypothetical protein